MIVNPLGHYQLCNRVQSMIVNPLGHYQLCNRVQSMIVNPLGHYQLCNIPGFIMSMSVNPLVLAACNGPGFVLFMSVNPMLLGAWICAALNPARRYLTLWSHGTVDATSQGSRIRC